MGITKCVHYPSLKLFPDEPIHRTRLSSRKRFKISVHAWMCWRRFSKRPRVMTLRRSAGMGCCGMLLSPPFRRSTQLLQASSRTSGINYSLCLRSQGYSDSPTMFKTMKRPRGSSRICGRLSPTTRFVYDPGTVLDADKDSRWCNRWQSMIKSS